MKPTAEEILKEACEKYRITMSRMSHEIAIAAMEEYAATREVKLPGDIKFPTREEIKAHFTTIHKPWKEDPYRKINYDRVTGAEWAFDWLRKQIYGDCK